MEARSPESISLDQSQGVNKAVLPPMALGGSVLHLSQLLVAVLFHPCHLCPLHLLDFSVYLCEISHCLYFMGTLVVTLSATQIM